MTIRIWVGRVFVGGLMSSISVGVFANTELWWEGDEWRVDENVEWFGLHDRVRRSMSGADECGVRVLCLSSSCLQQWYWGLSIVCMCVFAVYSINDNQVKWVINKNPREVVIIVLIIPIVDSVALIIPVVYPIIKVTVTIQLNTISTVTTVTQTTLSAMAFLLL